MNIIIASKTQHIQPKNCFIVLLNKSLLKLIKAIKIYVITKIP
jgi:hypothetical protein